MGEDRCLVSCCRGRGRAVSAQAGMLGFVQSPARPNSAQERRSEPAAGPLSAGPYALDLRGLHPRLDKAPCRSGHLCGDGAAGPARLLWGFFLPRSTGQPRWRCSLGPVPCVGLSGFAAMVPLLIDPANFTGRVWHCRLQTARGETFSPRSCPHPWTLEISPFAIRSGRGRPCVVAGWRRAHPGLNDGHLKVANLAGLVIEGSDDLPVPAVGRASQVPGAAKAVTLDLHAVGGPVGEVDRPRLARRGAGQCVAAGIAPRRVATFSPSRMSALLLAVLPQRLCRTAGLEAQSPCRRHLPNPA